LSPTVTRTRTGSSARVAGIPSARLAHMSREAPVTRFYVERSPAGGYHVKLAGADAPVSHHDTEEEAQERRAAYQQGVGRAPTTGEHVRLRDGSLVLVRPVRPDDKPLFVAAFQRLGPESRYRRFLGPKKALSVRDLEFFTELDHADHDALGALDPSTGEGLGVARALRRGDDRASAEAAVVVIDAWQGRGLGSALLARLAERARARGIERFSAMMLADNRAMLALFEHLGDVRVVRVEGSAMEVDVSLPVHDRARLGRALRAAASGRLER
jgi:GNAT superfamily N-acetyltransferase